MRPPSPPWPPPSPPAPPPHIVINVPDMGSPYPPDDEDSHADLWASKAYVLEYTGNHNFANDAVAWWEEQGNCASSSIPSPNADYRGGVLTNQENTVQLPDGDYVLCLSSNGVRSEHTHVTAAVHSSPPSAPPSPPSPPSVPNVPAWVIGTVGGDCDDACQNQGMVCNSADFWNVRTQVDDSSGFQSAWTSALNYPSEGGTLSCDSWGSSQGQYAPHRQTTNGKCYTRRNAGSLTCSSDRNNRRRLCYCNPSTSRRRRSLLSSPQPDSSSLRLEVNTSSPLVRQFFSFVESVIPGMVPPSPHPMPPPPPPPVPPPTTTTSVIWTFIAYIDYFARFMWNFFVRIVL